MEMKDKRKNDKLKKDKLMKVKFMKDKFVNDKLMKDKYILLHYLPTFPPFSVVFFPLCTGYIKKASS